ncbi:hypothetical protein BGW38_008544, partial [Lunasporangiospora selenospora]
VQQQQYIPLQTQTQQQPVVAAYPYQHQGYDQAQPVVAGYPYQHQGYNQAQPLQAPSPYAYPFGKQIQFQQIPEWQNHYMSYKGLKKIINSLIQEKAQISVTIAATPPPGSTITPATLPEDDYSRFLQSQKAEFFFKLERELEKVNYILRMMTILPMSRATIKDK